MKSGSFSRGKKSTHVSLENSAMAALIAWTVSGFDSAQASKL